MPNALPQIIAAEDDDLPHELHFLKPFFSADIDSYQRCDWLQSDFSASTWQVKLDSTFSIYWDIPVGSSGRSLISPDYEELLAFFKTWLVVQTHPDATGYLFYSDRSAYNTVRRALSLIEVILINADRLGITEFGLSALTEDTWRAVLQRIATNCESSESVYSWSTRLATHLRRALEGEDLERLKALIVEHPDMAELSVPRDEWLLDISDSEARLMRAMLWQQGRYRSDVNREQLYQLNITGLASDIYAHSLVGASALLPVPPELCFGVRGRTRREFRGIPVTMDTCSRRSKKDVTRLITCIDRCNLLSETFGYPDVDITQLDSLVPFLDLKSAQRFRSLPAEEGFSSMRRAVELFLEVGEDVSEAYARLTEATKAGRKSFTELSNSGALRRLLPRRLRKLGVEHWSVGQLLDSNAPDACYFERVRRNKGLFELMRVNAGGIQTVVGALAARRADELLKLKSGTALDGDRSRLVFGAGKKNVGVHRQIEARPIPPIAVEMIDYLEGLHKIFCDATGAKRKSLHVFSPILQSGRFSLRPPRGPMFYRATDLFCDYVETQRDAEGRRYYIRQHQLRRWFAMLFFWANSFGGADTLRWFLAHTDMQHLYHYVTDSVPGSVLRSAAAGWATAAILAERPETVELADFVQSHFGTHDVRLVDSRRLETYLEDLLEGGTVQVEPLFFDLGRRCTIGVRILEAANG